MRYSWLPVLLFIFNLSPAQKKNLLHEIAAGGNAWLITGPESTMTLSEQEVKNWGNKTDTVCFWFRIQKPSAVSLFLNLTPQKQEESISISIDNEYKIIKIKAGKNKCPAETWNIKNPGYVCVKLSKVSAATGNLSTLKGIGLSAPADVEINYVKNNETSAFYWARRGPSVHLAYHTPPDSSIEWFYNEVTVPTGNDVKGSYFMAAGFNEGYFGMQVNSEKERRILFSVWSSYQTDDPKKIPADKKIILIKKGDSVNVGEFGNEGSGGQSYLTYNWEAGKTYRFLVRAQVKEQSTLFSGYFFMEEKKEWVLISSMERPGTKRHLTGLYSFLENFLPETGNQSRMAFYGKGWARTLNGHWLPLNKATFTADATARKKFRMDFTGGAQNDRFFLKMNGFFNEHTEPDTHIEYNEPGLAPQINFSQLK